jgi:hypothetical protein
MAAGSMGGEAGTAKRFETPRAFAWIPHMHCLAIGFCYPSSVASLAKPSPADCSEIIAASLSKNTMDNLQTRH